MPLLFLLTPEVNMLELKRVVQLESEEPEGQ